LRGSTNSTARQGMAARQLGLSEAAASQGWPSCCEGGHSQLCPSPPPPAPLGCRRAPAGIELQHGGAPVARRHVQGHRHLLQRCQRGPACEQPGGSKYHHAQRHCTASQRAVAGRAAGGRGAAAAGTRIDRGRVRPALLLLLGSCQQPPCCGMACRHAHRAAELPAAAGDRAPVRPCGAGLHSRRWDRVRHHAMIETMLPCSLNREMEALCWRRESKLPAGGIKIWICTPAAACLRH